MMMCEDATCACEGGVCEGAVCICVKTQLCRKPLRGQTFTNRRMQRFC